MALWQYSATFMGMDKRMILNGAGTYYFKVHGAKDAPLFRSIFEYEYFKQLLLKEEGCELIAYVFSEYQAQWVMHCDQDWQIVLDNLRAHLQEQYFKLWHKHQQILSESAEVLLIEEEAFLVPLVLELHHWPVREGIVPRPEVYPWSSDQEYRQYEPRNSAKYSLNSHRMLKRLAKQRFNTSLRYERMIEQFEPWDIEKAKNRLYQALASDAYVTRHLRGAATTPNLNQEQIVNLREQAEKHICEILGAPIDQVRHPRYRRQFYQVEPLTIWLLVQTGCNLEQLIFIFDLDQAILQGWLRSIETQHPASFLNKLKQTWQEDLHIEDKQALRNVS